MDNTNEPLVSIVVAVYNTKEYVEQCITSVLAQTYQNIELILVVNGPTDGSDAVCKMYAEKDKRIKLVVFDQNQGVQGAWKAGIAEATGEYLGFVDSDDYIDAALYEQLMKSQLGYDLIVTKWIREEGTTIRNAGDSLALRTYTTSEDIKFLLKHILGVSSRGGKNAAKVGVSPFHFNKLYKTCIIKGIVQHIHSVIPVSIDVVITRCYILKCSSVLITDICGYHYRIRNKSMSHSIQIDLGLIDVLEAYKVLYTEFSNHPQRDILLPSLQNWTAMKLRRLPSRLDFLPETQNKTLVFPFINMFDEQKIVLCGAGSVGQNYWLQIRQHGLCKVNLWVDKRWEYYRREGRPVDPIERLIDTDFDYVVLAVFREELAEEIKQDLLDQGIPGEKILWRAPLVYSV